MFQPQKIGDDFYDVGVSFALLTSTFWISVVSLFVSMLVLGLVSSSVFIGMLPDFGISLEGFCELNPGLIRGTRANVNVSNPGRSNDLDVRPVIDNLVDSVWFN